MAQIVSPDRSSVAGQVVDVLEAAGIRRAFTVPGESGLELLDALEHRSEIELVSTRTEVGAAFMAEADAKLDGIPALACAGRAVGATNLSLGVYTAFHDSTPMLAILGQVSSDRLGRDAFQEIDLGAFYKPISKWVATATRADRLPALVEKGLRLAISGRPGPAVIIVPADLYDSAVEHADASMAPFSPPVAGLAAAGRARLLELLAQARRPVAIVGRMRHAERETTVAFAERFGIGCYTAFRRQDAFPNDHPNYLGHLATSTSPGILRALSEADLVLALGTRLDQITTQRYTLPSRESVVVQIDPDPGTLGTSMPVDLALQADVRTALLDLVASATARSERDWTEGHRAYLEAAQVEQLAPAARPHPGAVVAALDTALPDDAIVTNDAGNFSVFGHRHLRFGGSRRQLAPTNGAMGYGVPAAVAAKLAEPSRAVLALVGDGGFLMTGQEIETARRMGAPIVCVVFQNGVYGTIAGHQARQFGRMAAVDIAPLELDRYAEGLGCRAQRIDAVEDIAPALATALASDVPTVLDVRTDPDALLPGVRMADVLEQAADGDADPRCVR